MSYRTFQGYSWPNEDLTLRDGQHTAGHALGILLLDDFYWPFMPGDLANATPSTFRFFTKLSKALIWRKPKETMQTRRAY